MGIALVFLIQVRNHELALVGADAPGLGVARQKLDRVFSGQQREAGVVFDRAFGQFGRRRIAQLDIHFVAHVADGRAEVVLHFADEIDQRVLRAAALAPAPVPAPESSPPRHEILGAIQLEVIDLHRDGQLRDRIAQHQRVFQLPLFIRGGELGELLAGEVALPIIELGGRLRSA